MNKKYNGLLLASGGMDSTVLAYDLANKKQNIVILFIDYGQHCKEKEFATLKRMLPKQFIDNIEIIKIGVVSTVLMLVYNILSFMFHIGYLNEIKDRILAKFKYSRESREARKKQL